MLAALCVFVRAPQRGRAACYALQPASMQRAVAEDGIVLLMGNLVDPPHTEHVICVLFDRSKFTERDAIAWWRSRGKRLCA